MGKTKQEKNEKRINQGRKEKVKAGKVVTPWTNIQTAEFLIKGTAPLVVHRFSAKGGARNDVSFPKWWDYV